MARGFVIESGAVLRIASSMRVLFSSAIIIIIKPATKTSRLGASVTIPQIDFQSTDDGTAIASFNEDSQRAEDIDAAEAPRCCRSGALRASRLVFQRDIDRPSVILA